MTRIFVCSDHHLGHANILNFKRWDGTPLRDFKSLEEMHGEMIARHNEVVKPQDHVYFLGDVCINKRSLELVRCFNGHKRLVRGNHDIFRTRQYIDVGFEEIYGVRVFVPNEQQKIPGAVLSHVPLHPGSLQRWAINIHGHTHANFVTKLDCESGPIKQREVDRDPRYVCVCVEQTGYRPLPLDQILRENKKILG